MYSRRSPPAEPPCSECKVDLLAENEADAVVFMMTRNQFVVGYGGLPVDISIPAVKIAMDLCGIKNQAACLNRVRKAFHHFLRQTDES